MQHLSIDIETYSSADIGKAGAFKYAESEDFEILLFAYKVDSSPTRVVDMARGEEIPDEVLLALADPDVTKHAYNAAFEWFCLTQAGYNAPIDQWRCTMVHGMYCGYPAGLSAAGKAMGIPEDKQKLAAGKALINYFCKPCKPTKSNGGRTRNLPHHDPEKWELFKVYNAQDVEAEFEILQKLSYFPVPEEEWEAWFLDIDINARGVMVDSQLIEGALYLDQMSTEEYKQRAIKVTGLDNPKSNAQLLRWLADHGVDVPNMQKETVAELLEGDLPDNVREALELKLKLSKTSTSKYGAVEVARCMDGRVRGLLQFYGASRTGRWAGRLVQVQNLPRNYISTLDEARRMVKAKNAAGVKMIYGDTPDTLSQLIRTAFVPEEGMKLIVSDFSAIEARITAWLADESWVLDVFRSGGDIYCAAASQMFGVPVEKNGVNGDLRQKGKVATLALGYQGSPKALVTMGALKMGIPEEELPGIVDKWRTANPNIVAMWHRIDKLSKHTLETAEPTFFPGLIFRLEGDPASGLSALTVELPSGRKLFYVSPHFGANRFGEQAIKYFGINQTTKKWELQETYGGKLTENIVQAIARDCLAVTLKRVAAAGYKTVMHIHDEIVIEATPDQKLEDVNAIFARPIPWAPGLPLAGAGFESSYYKKD